MNKIFKIILFVSLIGVLFSSQLVFAEEPRNLEEDINLSMRLIRTSDSEGYLGFYQSIINHYTGEDLIPFKILHLKYLYLTGNETEFFNLLKEFPDNYVFETYLQVNKKKIEFRDILNQKNKLMKKDLTALWKRIHEIDMQVVDAIQKDKYEKILQMVGSQSVSNYPELDNVYKVFEGIWASTLSIGECGNGFMYRFLKDKDIPMVKYLVQNFGKHDSQQNLIGLLKLDIDLFKIVADGQPKIFDKNLYSEQELRSLFSVVTSFQKSQLSLKGIYFGSKSVNFSYDSKATNYIFWATTPYDPAKIDTFNATPVEELYYVSLSKDYIAVRLYDAPGTTDGVINDYLIFKKEKMGWKPVIRHQRYVNGGGC